MKGFLVSRWERVERIMGLITDWPVLHINHKVIYKLIASLVLSSRFLQLFLPTTFEPDFTFAKFHAPFVPCCFLEGLKLQSLNRPVSGIFGVRLFA